MRSLLQNIIRCVELDLATVNWSYGIILAASIFMTMTTSYVEAQDGFMNGVDVSALALLESDGAVYRDKDGTQGDAIDILQRQGIDWFRVRLFVEPTGVGQVVNDVGYTLALAQRIKAAGGNILLDLHYSDTWADPGQQTKPSAWDGLSAVDLVQRVEDYTTSIINQFSQAGVTPAAVQIGNEVSNGMLWDDGRLFHTSDRNGELDHFASLLQAGIRGVEQAEIGNNSAPQKWIHTADGSDWAANNYLLNQLEGRGVDFDTIAYSYYPRFHGSIEEVRENLELTSRVYGRPVVLAEIGFAHSGSEFEPQADDFIHVVSAEGQAEFAASVIEALGDVSHGLGRGAFWWHGDAVPTSSGIAWEGGRLGLFDREGEVLPAAGELGVKPKSLPQHVFTEENMHYGEASNAYGQSFVVGLQGGGDGPLEDGDAVELSHIKFVSGGKGVGADDTRLAIFKGSSVAFEVDDQGRMYLSADTSVLLAVSENSVDTQAASYGDALIFSFKDLDVLFGDGLSAVFVTESIGGDILLQEASQVFVNFNEVAPSLYLPSENYGGKGNLEAAALFGDYGGDMLLDSARDGWDLNFRVTLVALVPEPSTGCVLLSAIAFIRKR